MKGGIAALRFFTRKIGKGEHVPFSPLHPLFARLRHPLAGPAPRSQVPPPWNLPLIPEPFRKAAASQYACPGIHSYMQWGKESVFATTDPAIAQIWQKSHPGFHATFSALTIMV